MNNRNKALLFIIIGSIIGGAVSSVTKIGFVKIPPFAFTFLRFFVASICIMPFYLKEKVKYDKSLLPLIYLSVLPVLNIYFFVIGLTKTTASISQMLYATSPLLTVLFTYFFLKEKVSIKRFIFILIGLFGVLLIILLPLIEKSSLYSGGIDGNLLISIGVIVYSIYVVLSKPFQNKFSPVTITSFFLFLCTGVFFILAIGEFKTNNLWVNNLNTTALLSVLYVSIFATVASYLLNQYAIKYGGPVLSSLGFYLVPIFAYASAFLLLGEQLTVGLIIGTIITLISIALVTYSK